MLRRGGIKEIRVWIYLLRKGAYRDFLHIITHNKQQAGIKSICTEERKKKLWQLQICVQIFVVSVPPFSAI